MRLEVLNRGYGPGTKLLFALIRLFSGRPVPDAAKLVFYRPDFYGARAKEFTHEAMRGPSAWSVGDRELMAAYVSKVNESAFCIGAHSATARQAYQDGAKVRAVLADLESAPVEEGLRATLRMLGKLTGRERWAPRTCGKCYPPASHASRSRTRWRSAPRSTRPTGSPTPSASMCSAPRASRQEPSTCSSAVTGSACSARRSGSRTTWRPT